MFKKELVSMISFHGISPIHAGSGASTGAVDNPIQREKHTNWPVIQASAVKGAMRSHFRRFFSPKDNKEDKNELLNHIFGSDEQDGWDKEKEGVPGALSVSDAKILAMPVRSNVAPFVWVTSPAVLKRLKRDLEFAGIGSIEKIPEVSVDDSIIIGDWNVDDNIILEDVVVKKTSKTDIPFVENNFPEINKLLLISDEMFKYVVENCTEIQTQIKIDEKTGTAKDGALRYEELLPSDTLLYSIIYYSKSASDKLNPEGVYENVKQSIKDFIQLGGDETLGRGICRVRWIKGGKQ
ncbi:MAG: type III-B CRISPR module RAMP protein Cmr4 [Campylobacterota bacterium]|nr:type III-B CRISPR module RAMP protein Cmr4 [Campylobacterota bacterium]